MTYIVDAMSIVYAGYFSATSSKAYSGTSEAPNYKRAISRFLPLDKLSPTYVCWEGMKSTAYRKNLNEAYKSNRKWDPEVLKAIDAMKSLCEENNYREISVDGFEADDTIVALSKYLKSLGAKVGIVSRDRDLLQSLQKGYADLQYDPVQKVYLTLPEYDIIKYKALVGDTSDCIKGVTRIGKKKALNILAGESKLSESQEIEYKEALKLIDAEAHPLFNELYEAIRENIEKSERVLKLRLASSSC